MLCNSPSLVPKLRSCALDFELKWTSERVYGLGGVKISRKGDMLQPDPHASSQFTEQPAPPTLFLEMCSLAEKQLCRMCMDIS